MGLLTALQELASDPTLVRVNERYGIGKLKDSPANADARQRGIFRSHAGGLGGKARNRADLVLRQF